MHEPVSRHDSPDSVSNTSPQRESVLRESRRWMAHLVEQENVFLLLLATRWLSLLPPAIALFLPHRGKLLPLLVFIAAIGSNLLLSLFHPQLNRVLKRQPLALGFDLVLVVTFIALTGGTESPYSFYALTPMLAAAFFFYIRGGLLAVSAIIPVYLLGVWFSHSVMGDKLDVVEAIGRILNSYLITLIFAFLSLLLERMHTTTADLQRTQDELARVETLAAMGKLAAFLSHEIRNPLATLGGFARRIARAKDDPRAVERYASIIVEEAQRLEELLTDTLELSRSRKRELQPVVIHEILDRACTLAGSDLGPTKLISIKKRYDERIPVILANSSSLLRAFLNVIRNAIHFTPEDGTITLSTQLQEDHIEVAIEDNGPGIPAEMLATIFKPFVTHRPQGTGLGLVVAQQVIEEHGGQIQVCSEVGKGATFIFRLPVLRPSQSTAATLPSSGEKTAHQAQGYS